MAKKIIDENNCPDCGIEIPKGLYFYHIAVHKRVEVKNRKKCPICKGSKNTLMCSGCGYMSKKEIESRTKI